MAKSDCLSASDFLPPNFNFEPSGILGKKAENSKQPINRLPPELLSRIFAVGDEEQRSKRLNDAPHYGSQDIAVQICSHWRNVAINSPALWSYVYISQAPPHPHALVYLARSGAATPLIIDIEARTRYLAGLDQSPMDGLDETLGILTSHGATTDRWRSFILCVKPPTMLLRAIRFINAESVPILQFLSLRCKAHAYLVTLTWEYELPPPPDPSDEQYNISGTHLFPLHALDLNGLPGRYLFDHPLPLVSGLTHLKLTTSCGLYPLPKIHALLSSNSQLESLVLSTGFCERADFEPTTLRVLLPALRSLSLNFGRQPPWALAIIQMIDAPSVENLQLVATFDSKTTTELVERIITGESTGKLSDILRALHDGQPITYKTIYPMLRRLDLESSRGFAPNILKVMFFVLPTITHLSLPDWALSLLGTAPWILPNLECISTGTPFSLDRIVRRRIEMGFPIKRVEIAEESLGGDWPDSVEVVKHPDLSCGSDSDTEHESDYGDYHGESDSMFEYGSD